MWLFTLKKMQGYYRQMFVRIKNSHTYKIDMGSIVTISVLYIVPGIWPCILFNIFGRKQLLLNQVISLNAMHIVYKNT